MFPLEEGGKSEMVLRWGSGSGSCLAIWLVPALGVSCTVVSSAISSGAEDPQLKQRSNTWDVVFLRCWNKMWFSSLLTAPLRLCTMQP